MGLKSKDLCCIVIKNHIEKTMTRSHLYLFLIVGGIIGILIVATIFENRVNEDFLSSLPQEEAQRLKKLASGIFNLQLQSGDILVLKEKLAMVYPSPESPYLVILKIPGENNDRYCTVRPREKTLYNLGVEQIIRKGESGYKEYAAHFFLDD
jgi:hypothetical protein